MKAILDSILGVAFEVELDNMCGSNDKGKKNYQCIWQSGCTDTLEICWYLMKDEKISKYRIKSQVKRQYKNYDDFVYKLIHRKTEQMSKPKADLSVG